MYRLDPAPAKEAGDSGWAVLDEQPKEECEMLERSPLQEAPPQLQLQMLRPKCIV